MSERQAIVDVLSNYATGLDARDWVLWRSVFIDEVIFRSEFLERRGAAPLEHRPCRGSPGANLC